MISKYQLLNFLRRNTEDRGVMAALRCLLITEQRFRGWQQIAALGAIGELPVETIAGLYALHPMEEIKDGYNFGDACRLLAACRNKGGDSLNSPFDRRFRRLLACSSKEELCAHLTDIVRGMKSEAIPINYERLYEDISWWGDAVRERWAIHYWSNRKESEENVPN